MSRHIGGRQQRRGRRHQDPRGHEATEQTERRRRDILHRVWGQPEQWEGTSGTGTARGQSIIDIFRSRANHGGLEVPLGKKSEKKPSAYASDREFAFSFFALNLNRPQVLRVSRVYPLLVMDNSSSYSFCIEPTVAKFLQAHWQISLYVMWETQKVNSRYVWTYKWWMFLWKLVPYMCTCLLVVRLHEHGRPSSQVQNCQVARPLTHFSRPDRNAVIRVWDDWFDLDRLPRAEYIVMTV